MLKNTLYHEFTMILTGIFLFDLFWRLLYPFLSTSAAAYIAFALLPMRDVTYEKGQKTKSPWKLGGFGVQSKNWFKGKPWKTMENHGKLESFGGNNGVTSGPE